jgi:hypothetical protein
MRHHPLIRAAAFALAFDAQPAFAADAGSDVQRMLQQREQQQMELRLKMQQQQDRAVRPPPDATSDFRLRQLERDQQQRQQQGFDMESREAAARALGGASPEADRAFTESQAAEAMRADAEQERRYRLERGIEAGRPTNESVLPR